MPIMSTRSTRNVYSHSTLRINLNIWRTRQTEHIPYATPRIIPIYNLFFFLGAVSILPTMLYLTTGVIKEVATKSVNDETIIANSNIIQAALQLLKTLATDRYSKHDLSSNEWRKLLQSALGKIIDLTKTGCDETKLDEVTMMLTIAVFLLHTPSSLVSVPNLQYPCINHFRQCFLTGSPMVRLKCVQTMRSIFVNADLKVSTPYIHALAPRLIETLFAESNRIPASDMELAIILEGITTLEALIALAEPQNRKYRKKFRSSNFNPSN